MPAGLELPSVHKYWRDLGKTTPMPLLDHAPEEISSTLPESDTISQNEMEIAVQSISHQEKQDREVVVSIAEIADDHHSFITKLHEAASISAIPATRDYQPLHIISTVGDKNTPPVQIVSVENTKRIKDPLGLDILRRSRVMLHAVHC